MKQTSSLRTHFTDVHSVNQIAIIHFRLQIYIFHPFGPVILTVNLSQKQKNCYTVTYISAECVKCVSSPELY
jgi:hypothetical protein